MLQELHVKNLALIEEAELSFGEGLHILTGETGAGKSLLLGSVNLALGAKGGAELIRHNEDSALCELTFCVQDEDILQKLRDMEVEVEDDGILILSRKLNGARGSCRINGESFTASKMKAAAELLIDIHGQHEHQSLLKKSNHLRLLDSYAGDELKELLADMSKGYAEYMALKTELNAASKDDRQKEREIALLEHEINEIETADLKAGEDEELEETFGRMSNSEKIIASLKLVMGYMGGSTGSSQTASELVGHAFRELKNAQAMDEGLSVHLDTAADIDVLISDFNRSVSDYMETLEFDGAEYSRISERLDLINRLKSRYGRTIEEIKDYSKEKQEELDRLNDYELYVSKLYDRISVCEGNLRNISGKITAVRKKCALELSEKMITALKELAFSDVRFEVAISELAEFSRTGADMVEFLISVNPGESLKPLSEVASGGELSRVMLALRTIGAAKDGIDTLIFDEIDTGISGIAAARVAEKLSELSGGKQVICITHLPQIASFADHHYKIEKNAVDNSTKTTVNELSDEESLNELTRLLGGTASAVDNARELKDIAAKYKMR